MTGDDTQLEKDPFEGVLREVFNRTRITQVILRDVLPGTSSVKPLTIYNLTRIAKFNELWKSACERLPDSAYHLTSPGCTTLAWGQGILLVS